MHHFRKLAVLFALGALVGCSDATDAPIDDTSQTAHRAPTDDCRIVNQDVVIKRQADVRRFAKLGDCVAIHGSLVIRNTTVRHLDGMSNLRFVAESVSIGRNARLRNIDGLAGLEYVGEHFVVEGNRRLASMNLASLRFVEANYHVFNNQSLRRMRTPALESIGSQFIIATSPLGEVRMPSLAYTGDDFIIQHTNRLVRAVFPALKRHSGLMLIEVNQALRTFRAPRLKSVESTLEFDLNPALTNIVLPSMDFIGGQPIFTRNASLSTCQIQNVVDTTNIYDIGVRPFADRSGPQECALNFEPTGACRIIEGDVVIDGQKDLEDLGTRGAECVSIRGGLFVRNTLDVDDLSALSGLRFVSEWVSIARNARLTTLEGLQNLRFIGYGLVMERNRRLAQAKLPSLEAIGTVLHVFAQPTLKRLDLPSVEAIGDQWVFGGVDDMTFADLRSLEWIGAQIQVENNDSLQRIDLESLVHATAGVRVRYNQSLTGWFAPSLTHIGEDFHMHRNVVLNNLVLPSLEYVAGDIFIEGHPRVDNCAVYELIAQVTFPYVGGMVRILNDTSGGCPNFVEGQAGPIGQMPNWSDFAK